MGIDKAGNNDAVAFHDAIAHRWNDYYRDESFAVRLRVLDDLLSGRDLRGQRWLDAGCGTGVLARWLSSTKECNVHGVDASESMLAHAQPDSRTTFGRVETIAKTGLESDSFDGVLCSSVLEYIDQPRDALLELHRVLKPGGVLIISVPSDAWRVRLPLLAAYWLTKPLGKRRLAKFLDHSKHSYSVRSFSALLESAGFAVEQSVGLGHLKLPFGREIFGGGTLIMFSATRR